MPMSLFLLLSLSSMAGTDVWVSGKHPPLPNPSSRLVMVSTMSQPTTWGDADNRALAFLTEELAAVRPLADVFDGELQIMLRLDAAVGQVHALREQDRDLLYTALVYEGFAVQRYFQSKLDTDPSADAYITRLNGRVEITAWIEAVALNPEKVPTVADIPDPEVLLAFQEMRARHLLTQTATIQVPNLPEGARLVVNGRESATDQARVLAGRHLVAVTQGESILARSELVLAPGAEARVVVPATAEQWEAVAEAILSGPEDIKLSPPVQAAIASFEQPVHLIVTRRKKNVTYVVQGGTAQRVLSVTPLPMDDPRLQVSGAVGGGWLYDGEFLIQNYDEGAEISSATVNAATPIVSLDLEYRPVSKLSLTVGGDLALPLGEHQYLPVGDQKLRLRPYFYGGIGHPYLQVTVGPMLPWRIGVGARAHVPLKRHLELEAAYVYGVGLEIPRDLGGEFEATDAQLGWLGVEWRWRGLYR